MIPQIKYVELNRFAVGKRRLLTTSSTASCGGDAIAQKAYHRGAADAELGRNLAFADASSSHRTHLADHHRGGFWPAVRFAISPCLGDTRANSFTQDITLELYEHRQSMPANARPLGVVRSRASLSDTKPTSTDDSSCKVVTRSTTERPQRSRRQTMITSI